MAATKSMTREWKTRGKAKSRNSKIACYEYPSTPSATLRVARPSSKRDSYIVLHSTPPNICKILPRRRGSGSDKVDDEGVEKTRVQRTEYKLQRIIACYEYLSTPSALVIRLMSAPPQRGTAILLIQNPHKTQTS